MDREKVYNKMMLVAGFGCGTVHAVPFFLIFLVGQAGLANAALWGLTVGFGIFLFRYQAGPLAEALHQNVDMHIDDYIFDREVDKNQKALEALLSEIKRDARLHKWARLRLSLRLMSPEAFASKEAELVERSDERRLRLNALTEEKAKLKGDPRWKSKKSQS